MAKEALKNAKGSEIVENNVESVSEKGQKAVQQSMYSVGELAANARKLFGTRQECVITALKSAGKTECTVMEAKGIVEKFLKREVR